MPSTIPTQNMTTTAQAQTRICLDQNLHSPAHSPPKPYPEQPMPRAAHAQLSTCLFHSMPRPCRASAKPLPSPAHVQPRSCPAEPLPITSPAHVQRRPCEAKPISRPAQGSGEPGAKTIQCPVQPRAQESRVLAIVAQPRPRLALHMHNPLCATQPMPSPTIHIPAHVQPTYLHPKPMHMLSRAHTEPSIC